MISVSALIHCNNKKGMIHVSPLGILLLILHGSVVVSCYLDLGDPDPNTCYHCLLCAHNEQPLSGSRLY